MEYQFYQPDNSLEYKNILIVILIGIFISFFTSIVYILLSAVMPLIYVNVLITVGYGLSFGFLIQILSKIFKLKNFKSRLIVLIPILIIGYYFQWTHYIINLMVPEIPTLNDFINYSFNPAGFFELIKEIVANGTFEISNTLINGLNLKLVWLVEAIIIFIVPILYILRLPEYPYSEKLNKWYPRYTLTREFEKVYSKARFIINLKKLGSKQMTTTLGRGKANDFSKISIFYLERESKQYLMVEKITLATGNDTKNKIEIVVEPIEISTKEAKDLMEEFGAKKESYLQF